MADGRSSWPIIQYEVIGEAWQLYKQHWVVWSIAVVIVHLMSSSMAGSLGLVVGGRGVDFHSMPFFALSLLFAAIHALFLGGMIRMADHQIHGRPPRLSDMLDVLPHAFDLILAACLVAIAVTIGMSLCFIPGLIASGLFLFTIPLVAVNRFTAVEAMTQSFTALKSQWLNVTVFHIALAVVALSGVLLCGVGVLATAPLYPLSLAILNRRFFGGAVPASAAKPGDPFPEI